MPDAVHPRLGPGRKARADPRDPRTRPPGKARQGSVRQLRRSDGVRLCRADPTRCADPANPAFAAHHSQRKLWPVAYRRWLTDDPDALWQAYCGAHSEVNAPWGQRFVSYPMSGGFAYPGGAMGYGQAPGLPDPSYQPRGFNDNAFFTPGNYGAPGPGFAPEHLHNPPPPPPVSYSPFM
jgi:hypothetical protein